MPCAAQICRALIFLNVQADARDTSGPVSQLLAMTPPPSFSDANYSLVMDEAMFFVEIKPYTFSQRAKAVGVPLPLPPGCREGLRYIPLDALARADGNALFAELEQQLSHDQWEPVPERVELWSRLLDLLKQRPDLKTVLTPPEELEAQIQVKPLGNHPPEASLAAETPKPLFRDADAFREAVEELLPREARILLDAGLVLAGGFLGRIGAWLAGLCDKPPTADAKKATCDIDFFPLGTPEEALQSVRRALIALAKDCESTETGMFVVRSPHALTIGMDDCCFDLQIVLCNAETPADILAKFDIDASRFAYTPTRQLIASETAIRALLSGAPLPFSSPRHRCFPHHTTASTRATLARAIAFVRHARGSARLPKRQLRGQAAQVRDAAWTDHCARARVFRHRARRQALGAEWRSAVEAR